MYNINGFLRSNGSQKDEGLAQRCRRQKVYKNDVWSKWGKLAPHSEGGVTNPQQNWRNTELPMSS